MVHTPDMPPPPPSPLSPTPPPPDYSSPVSAERLVIEERPALFDFLMRMTGDLSRAAAATIEVFEVMMGQADQYGDYPSLKEALFTTARNFTIDAWNADTTRLALRRTKVSAEQLSLDAGQAALLEKIRALPGLQREAALLHHRHDFDLAATGRIMTIGQSQLNEALAAAQVTIRGSGEGMGLSAAIKGIPWAVPPPEVSQSTMAISQIIESVKRSRSGSGHTARWVWMFIALFLMALILWFLPIFLKGLL